MSANHGTWEAVQHAGSSVAVCLPSHLISHNLVDWISKSIRGFQLSSPLDIHHSRVLLILI
jgi:hypothetical protein